MTIRLLAALLTAGVVVMPVGFAARSSALPDTRLFFLDITGGRVLSANADGSNLTVLLSGHQTGPDGVVVDARAGHIYWTNMGQVSADDGSIERMDLDGSHLTTVVPKGGTFTPKQLKLDAAHGKTIGNISGVSVNVTPVLRPSADQAAPQPCRDNGLPAQLSHPRLENRQRKRFPQALGKRSAFPTGAHRPLRLLVSFSGRQGVRLGLLSQMA